MNDDAWIRDRLRAALPPTTSDLPPDDLWPRFGVYQGADVQRWTRLDAALLALAAVMLWLTPGAWVVLLHQL